MSESGRSVGDALLINRTVLRGPELSRLYNFLAANTQGLRFSEIVAKFAPLGAGGIRTQGARDNLNSALLALHTLELARVDDRLAEDGVWHAQPTTSRPFRTAVLAALRRLPQRQGSFMALYAWCVTAGHLDIGDDELLNVARANASGQADWNSTKIGFWKDLATYAGIVQSRRGGVLISPDPEALWRWLDDVAGRTEGDAAEVFTKIDQRLAPCFGPGGELHVGWAQSLDVLRLRGWVALRLARSDALRVLRAKLSTGTVWTGITVHVKESEG